MLFIQDMTNEIRTIIIFFVAKEMHLIIYVEKVFARHFAMSCRTLKMKFEMKDKTNSEIIKNSVLMKKKSARMH